MDLDLIIYYKGEAHSKLNPSLVKEQNLNEEAVEKLKVLHVEMIELKERMEKTDSPFELHELAEDVENFNDQIAIEKEPSSIGETVAYSEATQ